MALKAIRLLAFVLLMLRATAEEEDSPTTCSSDVCMPKVSEKTVGSAMLQTQSVSYKSDDAAMSTESDDEQQHSSDNETTCKCDNPGGRQPQNGYTCKDGFKAYCASGHVCAPSDDWTKPVSKSGLVHKDTGVLIQGHRNQNLQDFKGDVKITPNALNWETWTITGNNGKVLIKSHRNEYLQDSNGKVSLTASPGASAQWTISDAGNGKVFVTSHRNQNLQDNNGQPSLTNNKEVWESWRISNIAWGKICPKARSKICGNDALWPGQSIDSDNGNAVLAMQDDGNLVVYAKNGHRALWGTATDGGNFPKGGKVVMQDDCNLVVYGKDGKPVWDRWSVSKMGTAKRWFEKLKNAGQNLYNKLKDKDWKGAFEGGKQTYKSISDDPMCADNQKRDSGVCLVMQDDCNLVVYGTGTKPLWASNTSCR